MDTIANHPSVRHVLFCTEYCDCPGRERWSHPRPSGLSGPVDLRDPDASQALPVCQSAMRVLAGRVINGRPGAWRPVIKLSSTAYLDGLCYLLSTVAVMRYGRPICDYIHHFKVVAFGVRSCQSTDERQMSLPQVVLFLYQPHGLNAQATDCGLSPFRTHGQDT